MNIPGPKWTLVEKVRVLIAARESTGVSDEKAT
jgi:hypothetical protein